jgi:hypothetical protein
MALSDDKKKRKASSASTVTELERIISSQVPPNRMHEMQEYLQLFGYKPERTIIQVHIAGFFNRKRTVAGRESDKTLQAAKRYGGTTFVIVGRTHDPAIMDLVAKPKKKADQASPGYVGYLWKKKDPMNRAPHEVIPVDFTPTHFSYPQDWKEMFMTKGFMIAMHVPASFAKNKSRLTRALYRVGKSADVKKHWKFIDELRGLGYEQTNQVEDPLNILKVRLAKGEITKEYYEKLQQTLTS